MIGIYADNRDKRCGSVPVLESGGVGSTPTSLTIKKRRTMAEELYREKVDGVITDMVLGENNVQFVKENGEKITLNDHHDQDCCEHVYADWGVLEYYRKDIVGKKVKEMLIKPVENMGFLICFYQDWEKGEKIFVPCYNDQNGYYGSDLELIINGETKIDVSNYVEDRIN